jgi:cytosine/creatinine deaminase
MKNISAIGTVILDKIRKKGGWVNCHAHFDRAFTVSEDSLALAHQLMEKKWTLTDDIRKHSTEEIYAARIERVVKVMIAQGVRVCSTFIDIDPLTELRAIKAAYAVKKKYQRDIQLILMNQTSQGILNPNIQKLTYSALGYLDIIGGLPSRDRPNAAKHLDVLFSWAKETGKMAHMHIDQENNPREHDTDLLVRKTIQYGLEGKVVAVHAISVAAQPEKKRKALYKRMMGAGLGVVCCPSAALSMKALPYKTDIHNSIAPVVEMLQAGIPVALGVDNIADIYQPLVDGDMYTELRMLAESNRFYDIDALVDIATTNGRRVLGVK